MQYYKNLFINILYWLKTLCSTPNYSISRIYVEYKAEPLTDMEDIESLDDLWVDQSYDWTTDGHFYWDVTSGGTENLRRILETVPTNVTDLRYTIRYSYNNIVYKQLSRSRELVWPPERNSSSLKFRLPIMEAWACDDKDKPVVNVTRTLKKYSGPRGDFHNQNDVFVRDIVKYDLPQLRVKNMLGVRIFNENDKLSDIV